MASIAVDPAVNWQAVLAGLQGSEEWTQLLAELAGCPGGPSVAGLLQRAAARALADAPGSDILGGGRAARHVSAQLAEAAQQVAWEKLHTGDWHTVPVVWRNAYVAACILAAAAGVPGSHEQGAPTMPAIGEAAATARCRPVPAQSAQAEAAAVGSALWHLDMAAIMGGPLLRGLVDGLIEALQGRWQQLHAAGSAAAQAQQAQQGTSEEGQAATAGEQLVGEGERPQGQQAQQGDEQAHDRAAKRRRLAAAWRHAGGDGGSGEAAAVDVAAAADAALLPPWSLGPRGTPVAAAHLPSLEAFWRDHMSVGTPVVVSGAMEAWPAVKRWADPEYLARVAGPRTVPVEVGEHYLAEQWGQQLMTLRDFLQRHVVRGASGPQQDQQQQQGEQQQQPAEQQQQQAEQQQQQQCAPAAQPRGYLAQHPLFDQIPALAADIREPPYCCLGEGEVQSINAWFGPAGTVTPLHTDPHPNLLCQAVGRKYVRLYPPSATPAMYPHAEGMHTNSGRVDVDAPDPERFPLFGRAAFQDCVLEAGQMLFIPAGWWHYVKSTTVSFSVSYWWR